MSHLPPPGMPNPDPRYQGYQQPPGPAGPYGYPRPPKHEQATTVLIFGILGLVACQAFAPYAWWKGNKVVAEIQQSPIPLDGESEANIGRILGIVGSVLLIFVVVMFAVMFLIPLISFILLAIGTAASV